MYFCTCLCILLYAYITFWVGFCTCAAHCIFHDSNLTKQSSINNSFTVYIHVHVLYNHVRNGGTEYDCCPFVNRHAQHTYIYGMMPFGAKKLIYPMCIHLYMYSLAHWVTFTFNYSLFVMYGYLQPGSCGSLIYSCA